MGWSEWIRDGVEVEPSLYAADFRRLGDQVDALLAAGCRIFHFDCGDGHFVPPVTMGPVVLRSIARGIHEAGGRRAACSYNPSLPAQLAGLAFIPELRRRGCQHFCQAPSDNP